MAQLDLHGIDKFFGQTRALADIYLTVKDGEFVSLVGPSGCGKTTLLRIVAGLEKPSKGEVVIDGRVVNDLDPAHRNIAMVFQSYALYPHKTVFENIAFPLRMQAPWLTRVPFISHFLKANYKLERQIQQQVHKTATMMHLQHLLDRKPGQLSGGQRQRVALARAMVRNPKVFLMDEPLSNLDAKLRAAMRTEIIELQRRVGGTFIYVTHDQSEAMTMSDRVVILHDGCIQQIGAPSELYENPVNLFVAEFIGSPKINVLAAQARRRGQMDVFGSTLDEVPHIVDGTTLPTARQFFLGLRSESLTLVDTFTSNTILGSVHILENLGNEFLLTVRPLKQEIADGEEQPGDRQIVARIPSSAGRKLKPGDVVALQPSWEQGLLFTLDGFRLFQQYSSEQVAV